jgi:hypothetical protein
MGGLSLQRVLDEAADVGAGLKGVGGLQAATCCLNTLYPLDLGLVQVEQLPNVRDAWEKGRPHALISSQGRQSAGEHAIDFQQPASIWSFMGLLIGNLRPGNNLSMPGRRAFHS